MMACDGPIPSSSRSVTHLVERVQHKVLCGKPLRGIGVPR
jgi:hypothetical protein